ncbi:MAG: helix-turn-helix transcriptional regulator [Ruminococcaceae bacterium]|nr:helix-turn-helix transcriptional regulator [Oscillospiraceae bacterium]
MEIKLLREPNIVYESAMLLFNSRNGQSCAELKNAIQKKFSIDSDVLDNCFNAIIEISDYVTGSLAADEKLLDFLFARHSAMKGCFAFYIIHDACRRAEPDFMADVQRIRDLSKAAFFINFTSMLIGDYAAQDWDGDITNYGELFSFIETMPIPADEKFELCRLYNNFETYKNLLADIIEDAGRLFKQKYDVVKHYIGWFLSAISEPLNSSGEKFIEQNYDITLSPSVDVLYLQPSIVMCNTTKYLMSFTDEKVYDFFYVGVLFEPLKEITDSSTLEDKLCRNLRTIGDLRKFEILRLLAEGEKYGQQLASLLDLSTATISHHMSLLMECGFVEIKRESNRIYYCLNRKKIRDFIDELSSTLLT